MHSLCHIIGLLQRSYKMKYQLINPLPPATESEIILRSDGLYIPMNPANTDYQAYLKWVAEGNTPLPAE